MKNWLPIFPLLNRPLPETKHGAEDFKDWSIPELLRRQAWWCERAQVRSEPAAGASRQSGWRAVDERTWH
jgi:hypothetical protein